MADREQPYDPYIPPGGQSAQGQSGGNQRTAALQAVSERFISSFFIAQNIYERQQSHVGVGGLAGLVEFLRTTGVDTCWRRSQDKGERMTRRALAVSNPMAGDHCSQ